MEVPLYDSSYCRLCAEDNSSGVLLYSNSEAEADLSVLVNRYLPFKIHDDGKLPRTICPGCNIQLQATVQFFDLLVEGQKKIRELWRSQLDRQRRLAKERMQGDQAEVQYLASDQVSQGQNTEVNDETDKKILIQIMADGTMYTADHGMALNMEGLERPRRKRGRPPKRPVEQLESSKPEEQETEEPETVQDQDDMEEDADGRRRRKRKVPQRFKEAVQGKELERIFREEGVIDEDDPEDEDGEEVDDKVAGGEQDAQEEVIGHLETSEGQDLGELVIVNKNRGRGRPRGKRRKIRFECDICGRGFQQKGRFLLHKSFHKGVKFECSECKMQFTSREHLELHQKTSGHNGEGIIEGMEDGQNGEQMPQFCKYSCTQCDKTFRTKQSYEIHLKAIHEGFRPFSCEMCGKSFAYQNSLKCHMGAAHEEQKSEKGFPCDICGKMLNHPSSIIYHKESEHNNGRLFVCNKCGKGFKHKQLLQRHQLVHSDDRPFVCKVCGAAFKTNANLVNHQPTHTGEKKYFCELCGQQFAHKTSLTLHYRWHTGSKPYQCTVCNKSFTQNGNLQEHLRIHTGEKPYCCDYCGRKFTTSSQFKLHVKRHTGERPWKCEYCGKSFLHKDTWKCHTRRHKGERPYQCQYCARGFTEQWALKKHVRLHTGEKPYTCNVCGKSFADCSNLTKHKKIHRDSKEEGGEARMDGTVWNIIRTHLSKEIGSGGAVDGAIAEEDEGDGVQQIIYVTYQDPEDPEAKTLHIVDEMPAEGTQNEIHLSSETAAGSQVKNIVVAPDATEVGEEALAISQNSLAHSAALQLASSHTLQVTDEDGNPYHLTIQDGRQFQITSTDGQSIQVTAVDGHSLPLLAAQVSDEANTSDMQPQLQSVRETSEIEAEGGGNVDVGGVVDELVDEEHSIEFTTQDGQKLRLVTSSYVDQLQLPPEYLSTNLVNH